MNKKVHYSKEQLKEWVNSLSPAGNTVIGPVKHNGFSQFAAVKTFDQLNLNERTTFSPKDVVFPRTDVLFKFKRENEDIVVSTDEEQLARLQKTVILGMRPCDAESFDYLKKFFKEDAEIVQKIEAVTLVTYTCKEKFGGCFCDEMGLDKSFSDKTDILIEEVENGYDISFNEKGQKVLNPKAENIKDIPAERHSERNKEKTAFLSELSTNFNSDEWKMLSLGCMSCGACAFVCPTCTCYDIQDEGNTEEGQRMKCWDTCGLGLFTKHASGHNPKGTQVERRRHRIMHKFVYTENTLGTISCVGCGRCISACPSHLNLYDDALQVLNKNN